MGDQVYTGISRPFTCAKPLQSCPTLSTPWTAAHQAPLSVGFSRQESWNGLHDLLQRIFPTQGSNQRLLSLLHGAGGFYLGGPSRVLTDAKAGAKGSGNRRGTESCCRLEAPPQAREGGLRVWRSRGLLPWWPRDGSGAWEPTCPALLLRALGQGRLPEARKLFSRLTLVSFKVVAQGTSFQELNARLIRGTFGVITWISCCSGR